MSEDRIIIAIETSCDETAAAVLINGKVHSNVIYTQSEHSLHGGVIPEVASRSHLKKISKIVKEALLKAEVNHSTISAVAYTKGPGLLGSLLVGSSYAKGLALSLEAPLISVNHIIGHIYANFVDAPKPTFPFTAIVISGGHTMICEVIDWKDIKVVGQTQDDAIGEAFDKCSKMLGLGYPGGPVIDKLAQLGDADKYTFPISKMPGYDFSFSGIKTSVRYFLQKNQKLSQSFIEENINDLCASIQKSLFDNLFYKLDQYTRDKNVKQIAWGGGVSQNSYLRKKVLSMDSVQNYIPKLEYCIDNAAMIGVYADYLYQNNFFETLSASPDPSMNI